MLDPTCHRGSPNPVNHSGTFLLTMIVRKFDPHVNSISVLAPAIPRHLHFTGCDAVPPYRIADFIMQWHSLVQAELPDHGYNALDLAAFKAMYLCIMRADISEGRRSMLLASDG